MKIDYVNGDYNSGHIIKVERNNFIQEPIRVSYIIDNENKNLEDKNIIIAEEGSSIVVVIDYLSNPNIEAFHNGVTRVFADNESSVKIIKIQRLNEYSTHIDSNIAVVNRGANVEWVNLELGSKINITSYVSYLKGSKSKSSLYNAYFLDKNAQGDIYHSMVHIGEKSNSIIESSGVVKDITRKNYKGVISFKKGSKYSKGEQIEDVTLLNKGALVKSLPMSCSNENKVECFNKSTFKQVDSDKLLYYINKGFSEKEAKLLIIREKFNTVYSKIKDENLVREIENNIRKRLS